MANEVFANGLELACKAGDGKSVACFPDVCFSPLAPPAGWIPIPYPNTAYARDTTNGSITVFISGKPVMKKDRSYLRTSTGNEAAAGPKGIVTGVKKGQAYFASWSMNVMIEGQNVDRHTDLMTHNHGSMPGNTGVWHFLDTADEKADCKDEKERVEKACGGMKKEKGFLWMHWWVDVGRSVAWKLPECGTIALLIDWLRDPLSARSAGEAITFITGVDIAAENLDLDPDPHARLIRDEHLAADASSDLPVPDPERIAHCSKKDAPTICMEGVSNSGGSHGFAHDILKKSLDVYKEKTGSNTISYDEAKKHGLDAIQGAGALHCSRKCLEAQLDAHYQGCMGKSLSADPGTGGRKPGTSSDDNNDGD